MSEFNDCDQTRLIFDFCNHFKVPEWVSDSFSYLKDKQDKCWHCRAEFSAFGRFRRHHCRLCGEMVCTPCSSKYYLPPKYEKKGKTGPSRVCHKCRDSCLLKRLEKLPNDSDTLTKIKKWVLPNGITDEKIGRDAPKIISVPTWSTSEAYRCTKCAKDFKKDKPHHCRACGFVYCGTCTDKIDVPSAFNKKNKDGPQRVCDFCLYRLATGWKWAGVQSNSAPVKMNIPARFASNSVTSTSSPLPSSESSDSNANANNSTVRSNSMSDTNQNSEGQSAPTNVPFMPGRNAPTIQNRPAIMKNNVDSVGSDMIFNGNRSQSSKSVSAIPSPAYTPLVVNNSSPVNSISNNMGNYNTNTNGMSNRPNMTNTAMTGVPLPPRKGTAPTATPNSNFNVPPAPAPALSSMNGNMMMASDSYPSRDRIMSAPGPSPTSSVIMSVTGVPIQTLNNAPLPPRKGTVTNTFEGNMATNNFSNNYNNNSNNSFVPETIQTSSRVPPPPPPSTVASSNQNNGFGGSGARVMNGGNSTLQDQLQARFRQQFSQ